MYIYELSCYYSNNTLSQKLLSCFVFHQLLFICSILRKSANLKTVSVPKIRFRQLKKFVYLKAGSANLKKFVYLKSGSANFKKKFVYLKSGSANFNLKIFVYLKSGPREICILLNLACGKGPQKKNFLQKVAAFPRGSNLVKSSQDDRHVADGRKGDPQHYVE